MPQASAVTLAAIDGAVKAAGACEPEASGSQAIQLKAPTEPASAPANFDFFWRTVNDLYAECGGSMPAPDQLAYVAADGVIASLGDAHTSLLPPAWADQFRIDLTSSFEGIGATVNEAPDGGVLIVRTFAGSPAESAGLIADDVIIAVDGKDVTQLTLDEAVGMIRGPAGSDVTLTVERQGQDQPFDVQVTRARIDIPIVESRIIDGDLLYVALYDFSAAATQDLTKALQDGLDQGVKGIVFDLRGNPGGRLDVAIDVASMFIKEGVVVSESGHRNYEHDATGKVIVPDLPLAVLVDGGSASASEIVAGAIQDYGRGKLVGEPTYGKGSVQSLFDLSDGSLLRVTSAHWFTPKGRQIDGKGLDPDIYVVPHDGDATDVQLDAAVKDLQDAISGQS